MRLLTTARIRALVVVSTLLGAGVLAAGCGPAQGTSVPVDTRVSVGRTEHSEGYPTTGYLPYLEISADGMCVAIASDARNLIPGDENKHHDIFVYDRRTGAVELASVASDGTQSNGDVGFGFDISGDGRYVVFESGGTNLVPDDTNDTMDIFLRDRQTKQTKRVNVASDGTQANGECASPAISDDGCYVTFASAATNLIVGDTNGCWDVFVHDLQTGKTERISISADEAEGNGNSTGGVVSADGRCVAFRSSASNLVAGDTNQVEDVFIRDRVEGETIRISVASRGEEANGRSSCAAITPDGRYVLFTSRASNLMPGDAGDTEDVFVHDCRTGVTECASVASDGSVGDWHSSGGSISSDGRFVAFSSLARNLADDAHAGDEWFRSSRVFLHDRSTGRTERISQAGDEVQAQIGFPFGDMGRPSISADGRHVAYYAAFLNHHPAASSLPEGGSKSVDCIFIYDRETGRATRIFVASDPSPEDDAAAERR
jgi:Tol biopolymer transport system component